MDVLRVNTCMRCARLPMQQEPFRSASDLSAQCGSAAQCFVHFSNRNRGKDSSLTRTHGWHFTRTIRTMVLVYLRIFPPGILRFKQPTSTTETITTQKNQKYKKKGTKRKTITKTNVVVVDSENRLWAAWWKCEMSLILFCVCICILYILWYDIAFYVNFRCGCCCCCFVSVVFLK